MVMVVVVLVGYCGLVVVVVVLIVFVSVAFVVVIRELLLSGGIDISGVVVGWWI